MLGTRRLAGVVLAAAVIVAQAPATADARSPVDVTHLRAPDGAPVTYVRAINDRGEVLGAVVADDGFITPVLWRRGEVTAIGDPGTFLDPRDLSERGHVVGLDFRSLDLVRPFLWHEGQLTDLPTTAPSGAALDVNDNGDALGVQGASPGGMGQMVGWIDGALVMPPPGVFINPSFSHSTVLNSRRQAAVDVVVDGRTEAAVWDLDTGAVTMLGTLGGPSSWVRGINEAGDVIGLANTATGESHAFLWRRGRMVDLGTLGGPFSEAVALNDRGDVVGMSTARAGASQAFLWRNGRMVELPSLGGTNSDPASRPAAINERGQVVGVSTTPDGRDHAVLWEHGRVTDLGALLALPQSSGAVDIDGRGRVLGQVYGNPEIAGVMWST